MAKKKILLLVFALGLLLSCKKDSDNINSEGFLTWNLYGFDCGFFIKINDHLYKPDNESIIDDSFKSSNGIIVIVEYQLTNRKIESYCGIQPIHLFTDGIKIISITKK